MRIKRYACAAIIWALAIGNLRAADPAWTPAKPGYRYVFPRDHFSHPEFQTEWWYYTGNLQANTGERFGYELTFFRQANHPDASLQTTPVWKADQVYLAHLALTDVNGKRFFHTQRLNRAGPGLAGASQEESRYWNGNWEVRWLQPGANNNMRLQAIADELCLELDLSPTKPLTMHGQDGISRKGPREGESSHYLSFTRIESKGKLQWRDKSYAVTGVSWMDHEFFSEPPDNGMVGWDWYSVQLENNTELMLYRIRRDDATRSFSSGTFIDEKGISHFLDASAFTLTPGETWKSADTKANYPIRWRIAVPSLELELEESALLPSQELSGKSPVSPSYWEGAVNYTGTMRGKQIHGAGYLEMTGYGTRMKLGIQ